MAIKSILSIALFGFILCYGAEKTSFREGQTTLHRQARNGTKESILELLNTTVYDINAIDILKMTPLHYAAEAGNVMTAKVIIKHGGKIGALDNQARTPLHIAIANGNIQMVQFLVKQGADINGINPGQTSSPLCYALHNQQPSIFLLLAEKGAMINGTSNGIKPIIEAMNHRVYDMVEFLLDKGVSLYTRDASGESIFHICVRQDNVLFAQKILDRQFNVNDKETSFGKTPLHIACEEKKSIAMIDLLINRGAEIESVDNAGRTPLYYGIVNMNKELVAYLLKKSAAINNIVCRAGRSAVYDFVFGLSGTAEQAAFLDYILSCGADATTPNSSHTGGMTPLHAAAAGLKINFIPVLLKYGASTQAVDSNGVRPIDVVAKNGRPDLVEATIKALS